MKNKSVNYNLLFISDVLDAPFDEGFKNVALSLHRQLQKRGNSLSITKSGNRTDGLNVIQLNMNKLFFNFELARVVLKRRADIVIYLPLASMTFNSFVRAKVLKLLSKASKIVLMGLQHCNYSSWQMLLISRYLKPDLLFVPERGEEVVFLRAGLNVKKLTPAVDIERFHPVSTNTKKKYRQQYGITEDAIIILHVGHIKQDRNIECFINIQKMDGVQVIIVGSASEKKEMALKNTLIDAGIRIIDDYIDDIETIYNLSDIYVFPVVDKFSAIGIPLSVLEAMACNLPVISTEFGDLPAYFPEDEGIRYFKTDKDLILLIKEMKSVRTCNRKKVEQFSWERFTDNILSACETA